MSRLSQSNNKPISESIKVFIRPREFTSSSCIKSCSDNKSCVYYNVTNKTEQRFVFDYFFDSSASQEELYNTTARPIVCSALLGYSGTILAYGPTSSGKTFTMRGGDDSSRGIIPRCIEHLLQEKDEDTEIWLSYVQIYCETITDLLSTRSAPSDSHSYTSSTETVNQPISLSIRENNGGKGVYVDGLSKHRLTSLDDLREVLQVGDLNRCTASTNMNEFSSRSHAALMVEIIVKGDQTVVISSAESTAEVISTDSPPSVGCMTMQSTLFLVDLAGSERASASEGKGLIRQEEAKSINLSLSALGNCMNALAEKRAHIPYRDSKLTRLLQCNLGTSARTAVIVTIAPDADVASESLGALRFASRAAKVKVVAKVSQYQDYEAMYREMKDQFDSMSRQRKEERDGELFKDSYVDIITCKDQIIEQRGLEIADLKRQLAAYINSAADYPAPTIQKPSKQIILSGSNVRGDVGDDENAHTNKLLSEQQWVDRVECLKAEHARALDSLKSQHSISLIKSQQSELKCKQELINIQDDLKAERVRSLSTMQQLRQQQEKRFDEEAICKARIAELLNELSAVRNKADDYEAQVQALQQQLDSAVAPFKSSPVDLNDYVSKEKVKEMEALFIDTVTKLSGRVNALEGRSGVDSNYAVSSKTSQNESKHVRLEPGGRIRCATTSNNNSTSGSNGTLSNNHGEPNSTLTLQQSHSADTIILRGHEENAKGKSSSIVSGGSHPTQQKSLQQQQQRDKLW